MATKNKLSQKDEKLLNWRVPLLIIITFSAFFSSLNNEFVNWDDMLYIMNNDLIRSFSWNNMGKIFTSLFGGNYHPFVHLSFSIDFHLFKFAAPGYHLHNLVLHILNTLLVYAFFFHAMKKNVVVAFTVAVLFAIHPMHVESVAWVSERKDLLYTLYFFLSLIAYLFYIQKGRPVFFILSLILFLFSLLSKAQAVTLPLVLFLVDYLLSRKFQWKMILEKIPFLVLSVIFGVIAIIAQGKSNAINPLGIPAFQMLFYAPYSLWIYLIKCLVPYNLLAFYNYPVTTAGTVPLYIYFSPLILPAIAFALWKARIKYKYFAFGLSFFLVTIFPVLQFLPVGENIICERYTYVPYVGLFGIGAVAFWEYRSVITARLRKITGVAGIILLLLFMIITWNRNHVWKNSITLWTDVIEKNPGCVTAYLNRSFMLNENRQYEDALKDCNEGLKVDSTSYKLYKNRGIVYGILGKYDLALKDYSSAIRYNPGDFDSYLYRGIIFTDKFASYDAGIADFKKYLSHSPDNLNANFNMIVANYNKGRFDSARVYCLKVLRLSPGNEQARQLLEQIDNKKP